MDGTPSQRPPNVYLYVYAVASSMEAEDYGKEIAALGSPGIAAVLLNGGAQIEPPPKGLILSTPRTTTATAESQFAMYTVMEMTAAGLPVTYQMNYAPPTQQSVILVIGVKPEYN